MALTAQLAWEKAKYFPKYFLFRLVIKSSQKYKYLFQAIILLIRLVWLPHCSWANLQRFFFCFLVWRVSWVSLKKAEFPVSLSSHDGFGRYPSENWLSSRCLTSVIVQALVFPPWHQPLPSAKTIFFALFNFGPTKHFLIPWAQNQLINVSEQHKIDWSKLLNCQMSGQVMLLQFLLSTVT